MSFFFGGGGDGFPGMGGMGGGRSREPANTTEFYETLNVPKDATKGAIKKAYHKLCKTHHPDKGGDAEQVWPCECAACSCVLCNCGW